MDGLNRRLQVIAVCLVVAIYFPIIATSAYAQKRVPFTAAPVWSAEGDLVAVAVNDRVEIWDTSTARTRFSLSGHSAAVSDVAWSPNGLMIATASQDQTVRVWERGQGLLLRTLVGQDTAVTSVIWSPDSMRLISWGYDTNPNLLVWDVSTGTILGHYNGGSAVDMAFSPDGIRLAISVSLLLYVLDGQTFSVIASTPEAACCANQMYTLAWSHDSSKLVAGSLNGLVTIWDANTMHMLNQFIANPHYAPDSRDVDSLALSWVRDVAFAPDGQSVRAVSGDGTVREWSLDGVLLQETQIGPLASAAWSPYTARLAVLELTTLSGAQLAEGQTFDASELRGDLRVVVPFATSEEFTGLAQVCGLPETAARALTAMEATEDQALSSALDRLPTGCAADLRALAEAIRAQ